MSLDLPVFWASCACHVWPVAACSSSTRCGRCLEFLRDEAIPAPSTGRAMALAVYSADLVAQLERLGEDVVILEAGLVAVGSDLHVFERSVSPTVPIPVDGWGPAVVGPIRSCLDRVERARLVAAIRSVLDMRDEVEFADASAGAVWALNTVAVRIAVRLGVDL